MEIRGKMHKEHGNGRELCGNSRISRTKLQNRDYRRAQDCGSDLGVKLVQLDMCSSTVSVIRPAKTNEL